MTITEIRERITSLADQLDEQHTVLSTDLPKNEEGFVIDDGSDLCDALKAIEHAVAALSRLAAKTTGDSK